MKSVIIYMTYFSLFAAASLLIPTPIFRGGWLCALVSGRIRDYVNILSAVSNGTFYGMIPALRFAGLSRRLAE